MREPDAINRSEPLSFTLGECEIRPDDGTVSRGGAETHLEPKVMAVLAYLAQHRGRVVPKEELLKAVWPDAAVEEIALARCVSELRRALGDDAKHPRFIETLHRRGYRLLAEARSPRQATGGRDRHLVSYGLLALVVGSIVVWGGAIPSSSRNDELETPDRAAIRRIAVLPFENLGPSGDAYLAAGMTEEITSRLATVHGLAVTSRTSCLQYAGTLKTIPVIAAELGVDYVLEGSVRWEPGGDGDPRVRITPQLIRAADDAHLWSDVYDRDAGEIFSLQTELAVRVIRSVGGALLSEGERFPASPPTANLAAYQAYLRGLHIARDPTRIEREAGLRAVRMFERAVELDPKFALAHAELSSAHSFLYHFGYDREEERRNAALEAARRALELEPGLPRAHLALGHYHYRCLRDYDAALREYLVAEAGLPAESEIVTAIAYLQRRQGDVGPAATRLEAAQELDPLNALLARELGLTYAMLRDYDRAGTVLEQAVALSPDLPDLYFAWAWTDFLGRGDWAGARSILAEAPVPPAPARVADLALLAGEPTFALERLAGLGDVLHSDQVSLTPRALLEAFALEATGETVRARVAYASAARRLESELASRPEDYRAHVSLGLAYAGLGRRAEAVRHGEQGVALLPVSRDANGGPFLLADLARIYTAVGRHDDALDALERLLALPAGHALSPAVLESDPRFRPLRGLPRFKRLVES